MDWASASFKALNCWMVSSLSSKSRTRRSEAWAKMAWLSETAGAAMTDWNQDCSTGAAWCSSSSTQSLLEEASWLLGATAITFLEVLRGSISTFVQSQQGTRKVHMIAGIVLSTFLEERLLLFRQRMEGFCLPGSTTKYGCENCGADDHAAHPARKNTQEMIPDVKVL